MRTVTYDENEWALVPKAATEEMHAAAVRTIVRCHGNDDFPPRVLAAMIAAAPDHPATAGDAVLAADHKGMQVDYRGLLTQARAALQREPGLAEMLLQLQGHLTELGTRWYAGDTVAVDELLQLYCVENDTREALKAMRASKGGE